MIFNKDAAKDECITKVKWAEIKLNFSFDVFYEHPFVQVNLKKNKFSFLPNSEQILVNPFNNRKTTETSFARIIFSTKWHRMELF